MSDVNRNHFYFRPCLCICKETTGNRDHWRKAGEAYYKDLFSDALKLLSRESKFSHSRDI